MGARARRRRASTAEHTVDGSAHGFTACAATGLLWRAAAPALDRRQVGHHIRELHACPRIESGVAWPIQRIEEPGEPIIAAAAIAAHVDYDNVLRSERRCLLD